MCLDWHPEKALGQPVLAEDCDTYAFLERNSTERNREFFTLWVGQLGNKKAKPEFLKGQLINGAVAIARGCNSVLVRDDSNALHIVRRTSSKTSQSRSLLYRPRPLIWFPGAPVNFRHPWQRPRSKATGVGALLGRLRAGLLSSISRRMKSRSSTLLNGQPMLTGLDGASGPGSMI